MANQEFPLQIAFRNIDPSAAIEARVRTAARKLARFHGRITSVRVVIAAPENRHHRERLYDVRISLAVPGGTIWINRGGQLNLAHADVYVAIRDAFNAAVRRLEDFVRRHESKMKHHEAAPHGVVSLVNREEGYGFIAGAAGDEVYFHRTSVVNDAFNRLRKGAKVRYTLGTKARGSSPQASTVHRVGKHNPVGPV
ncbi:MAG TPA: HPF/RaiA family ribosome-associated protein [Candidatus Acidoferrum sp.]|nr:HPF/RaiA family ribosome-associated protein [Candidatus Acidoferrum sp.]